MLRRAVSAAACVGLLFALPLASRAADPPKTGFETSDGAEWTSHEDELAFLAAVDAMSDRMSMEVVGTSEDGRPLHLVKLGHPRPATPEQARNRPTQLHVCTQHGNEPAGREACLIRLRDLALGSDDAFLSKHVVLVVPTANPDGRAINDRENASNVDVNRDHLNLVSPEARAIATVVRDWQPDLSVDHHEYGPAVPVFYDDELLYLWPRNLNVDEQVHDIALEFSKEHLGPCATEAGYTSDEYGLYAAGPVDVRQTAGDGDEGIMRNAMGLRHSLGILVESAVTLDPRNGPGEVLTVADVNRRRVASQATVVDCSIAFMKQNGDRVAAATLGSVGRKIAEGRDRSAPVYFQGQDEDTTIAQDAPETVSADAPCAYDLTAAQYEEVAPVFDLHGITATPRQDGGVRVSLAQPAEPLIPLLLDARNEDRYAVEGTPLNSCPAVAAPPTRPRPDPPAPVRPPAPSGPLPATGGELLPAYAALAMLALAVRLRRRA